MCIRDRFWGWRSGSSSSTRRVCCSGWDGCEGREGQACGSSSPWSTYCIGCLCVSSPCHDNSKGNQMSSTTMKLEKLLEAVPDALVGMDQEGVIRFVNRQTELLFGYDRDELIGQLVETLVPESLWQIYAQNREQYFADPRTRSSGPVSYTHLTLPTILRV